MKKINISENAKKTLKKLLFFFVLFGSLYFVAWLVVQRLPPKHVVDLYAPHRLCLAGDEQIISVFQTGDLQTFISYMLIGTAFSVLFFVYDTLTFEHRFWFFLTGLFVFFCGFGHLIDYYNIENSYYYYKGISTSMTGLISLFVAAYTAMLLPSLILAKKTIEAQVKKLEELENKII